MIKLDEFLRVSQEVELPSGEKVTLRVLSDLEMNARRDYALNEVVRVSNQLKDPESDLYKTKIAPLGDSSMESLIDLMAQGRMYELEREARELYKIDFAPAPDEPTLLEEVATENKQSSIEMQVYKDRTKYIVEGLAAYRAKVAELPKETMMKELHARAIQAYSYSTSQDAEVYYTVWCATENNGKKHWKSVDHVHQLPMKVIDHIYMLYKGLDSIDPWEITKSVPQRETGGVGEDAGHSAE